MLFNSLHFVFFFPLATALYFLVPPRRRWIPLLIASYYFYMCWRVEYVVLLLGSTLVDYLVALRIHKSENTKTRKRWLLLSIASNLGLLFFFKYFTFLNESARAVFDHFNLFYGVPAYNILLPIGISFFTFQSMSYTIDVYRGKREPVRHIGLFGVYVSFFPQLVAGPIETSTHLLPQLEQPKRWDSERAVEGLKLMMWGFFKKLVIADRLALLTHQVYNNPDQYAGMPMVLAIYATAYQIYCDFSGYTDIARGAAKIMGYDLLENFNRPFFSKSTAELWNRWHMTLGSWFRSYLYIPMGGNRVKPWQWQFNLAVVFFLSGVWHGADWTYVIWGLLNSFYVLFSINTQGLRDKLAGWVGLNRVPGLRDVIRIVITFHLFAYGMIFVVAPGFESAWLVATRFASDFHFYVPEWLGITRYEMLVAVAAILFMEVMDYLNARYPRGGKMFGVLPTAARWGVCLITLFAILILGKFIQMEFFYFQF